MIVSSGKWKGMKILCSNDTPGLRPTGAKMRSSIVSMISSVWDEFGKLEVLDLFAGSGAMGLSIASELEASVTFVENDLNSIDVLSKNIASAKSRGKTQSTLDLKINNYDLMDSSSYNKFNKKYQIVFADPPYLISLNFLKNMIEYITSVTEVGGWFIMELPSKTKKIEDMIKLDRWIIIKTKKFGSSSLFVLERLK